MNPGTTLGKYTIDSFIGGGGFGRVFRAIQGGPGGFSRPVAIKVLRPGARQDESLVRSFSREARIIARLQHRNIVQVFDFAYEDHVHFLVMEYIDGVTLTALERAVGTSVPLWLKVSVGLDVCRGLQHAHNLRDDAGKLLGIVHRDVKPSNVLIGRQGDVKLTDFGLAKMSLVDSDQYTDAGTVKGTPAYMSPEQWRGLQGTASSDVFSLAAVLYEFCTNRAMVTLSRRGASGVGAFEPISKIVRDAPVSLDKLILGALSADPPQRPSSTEMMEQLQEILSEIIPPSALSRQDEELARWVEQIQRPQSNEPPVIQPAAPAGSGTLTALPDHAGQAFAPLQLDNAGAMLDGDPSPSGLPDELGSWAAADPPTLIKAGEIRLDQTGSTDRDAMPPIPATSSVISAESASAVSLSAPETVAALSRKEVISLHEMEPSRPPRRRGRAQLVVLVGAVMLALGALATAWCVGSAPPSLHSDTLTPLVRDLSPSPSATRDHSAGSVASDHRPVDHRVVDTTPSEAPDSASAVPSPDVGAANRVTLRAKNPRPPSHAKSPPRPPRPPRPHPPKPPVDAQLAPTGLLSVNSKPWAQVYIDDRLVGTTPLFQHSLPSGPHRLLLVTKDGRRITRRVVITGGRLRNEGVIAIP